MGLTRRGVLAGMAVATVPGARRHSVVDGRRSGSQIADPFDLDWLRRHGRNRVDSLNAVTSLSTGGFAFVGHTVGPTSEDVWIGRTTEAGHRRWSTVALRTATARVFDVVEDLSGVILAPGWYRTSRTESEALLLRVAADGSETSWETYDGGHRDAARSAVPIETGNYHLIGYTQGTESGTVAGLVQVVRPDGTAVARTADSMDAEVVSLTDGVRAPDGGCLAVGRRLPTTDAESRAVVAKYGPRGERQWWQTVGPDRGGGAETVDRHPVDGYVVGGNDDDLSDGLQAWLGRIDESGGQRWRTRIGDERARLNSITLQDGTIIAGGLVPSQDTSTWVGAVSPSGERLWSTSYGPSWLSSVASLTTTADGGIVAGGNTLLDEDGQNGFLAKLIPSARDPVPDVTVVPRSPDVGEEVTYDASGSTAPDGEIVRYDWDIYGDSLTDAHGPVIEITWDEPGTHEVTLRIVDDDGRSAVTTISVTVGSETGGPRTATADSEESIPGFGPGAAAVGLASGVAYRLLRNRDR